MKAQIQGNAAADILVRPTVGSQSLKDFARQMFAWLGIHEFEEDFVGRDGDHQVFVGSAVGITVVIGQTGIYKANPEKYPFTMTLAPHGTRQAADYLVQHAHLLAWRLSHEGFRCFVPKNHAVPVRSEQDGMVYDA